MKKNKIKIFLLKNTQNMLIQKISECRKMNKIFNSAELILTQFSF